MRLDYEARGIPFDPLEHCGHRYAYSVLPDELIDAHLAWTLSGENMTDYFHIIETKTLLQVQEALAHRLAQQWISEEEVE